MELKTNNGQQLVSNDELHAIKKFALAIEKFKTTYFVFNRQLNNLFKLSDKLKGEQNGLDNK